MDLSIIIISNNCQDYLKKCLNSIYHQNGDYETLTNVEVIISVLNNQEITFQWIDDHNKSKIKTTIVTDQAKDFNRSRARNLGLSKAIGKKVLFLDCDVMINPDFVKNFLKKIDDNVIGIHYLYGYKVQNDDELAALIKRPNPFQNLDFSCKDLLDYREPEYELHTDDVNKSLTPWSFAWGSVLSVNRETANSINGFDENFTDWGIEDTDFSLRLFKLGQKFVVDRDSFGLHIPHVSQVNSPSTTSNKKLFFQKFPSFATELTLFYPTFLIDKIVSEITQCYLFNTNLNDEIINEINQQIEPFQKSLALGVRLDCEVKSLNFNTFFIVDPHEKRYKKQVYNKTIINAVGLLSDYADNEFDVAYIFDSLQFLPATIYRKILNEMWRISKRVIETKLISSFGPYQKTI